MSEGARKLPGPALFWMLVALVFAAALVVVIGRESLAGRPAAQARGAR
jgi:hypothetical protein